MASSFVILEYTGKKMYKRKFGLGHRRAWFKTLGSVGSDSPSGFGVGKRYDEKVTLATFCSINHLQN